MPDSTDSPADEVPQAVIRKACEGDQAAFGILFRELYGRVHRTARGMMGNDFEAHEVAQEAWLRAWTHRERFNYSSRYSTWIHRITVNCSLDALRRRKRLHQRFISLFREKDSSPGSVATQLPTDPGSLQDQDDPGKSAERSELAQHIQEAVDRLPDTHRTVLVLREFEGYTYEQIAKVLGIQKGTVMSRLYHARKKLQSNLQKENP